MIDPGSLMLSLMFTSVRSKPFSFKSTFMIYPTLERRVTIKQNGYEYTNMEQKIFATIDLQKIREFRAFIYYSMKYSSSVQGYLLH